MTACRFCGCTEIRACVGDDGEPCWWFRPGYCSACAQEHITVLVEAAENFDHRATWDPKPLDIGGWPIRVFAGAAIGITIYDHVGAVVVQADQDGFYLAPHYSPVEVAPLLGVKIEARA